MRAQVLLDMHVSWRFECWTLLQCSVTAHRTLWCFTINSCLCLVQQAAALWLHPDIGKHLAVVHRVPTSMLVIMYGGLNKGAELGHTIHHLIAARFHLLTSNKHAQTDKGSTS